MSHTEAPTPTLTAIVLAGQRDAADPLTTHTGASCKALVELAGKPVLLRVIEALSAARSIADIRLSGPNQQQFLDHSELQQTCHRNNHISWAPADATPSTSAYRQMRELADDQPVMLTSADHAFLDAAMVDSFCQQSLQQDADVTVGLAPYALVQKAFPDMKKTVMRFSDGEYCGCNLFGFLTPASRRAADHWRAVESARKSPLRVIRILGWWPLLRYRLGLLSLPAALEILSKRFDLRIRAVILERADAAIDVDSVADYEIVQREYTRRAQLRPGIQPARGSE